MNKTLKKIQEHMVYLLPVFLVLGIIDYRFHNYYWPYFNVLKIFEFSRFFDFLSVLTVFMIVFVLISVKLRFKWNKYLTVFSSLVLLGGLFSYFGNSLLEPVLREPIMFLGMIYVLPALVALVLVDLFKDKKLKDKFERSLVWVMSGLAFLTIFQFFSGFLPGAEADFMGRAVWPYIDPFVDMKAESANWLSFIYAPVALLGFMKVKNGEKCLVLPSLVLLLALFLSKSYGGILTLFLLSFVYLFFNVSKKAKIGLVVSALLFGGLLVASQWNTPKFQALIGNYHMPNSVERRAQIYEFNWEAFKADPVFGVGLANYQSNFRENQESYLSEDIPELELPPHPHNLIFNFWSDLGLFGLIAIVALYGFVAWNLLRKRWEFLLICYPLVHGLIDTPYYLEEVTVLFWVLLALGLSGMSKRILAK